MTSLRSSSTVRNLLACLFLACTPLVGAEYIGALQCGACHSRQFERQSRSAHALALSKTVAHPKIGTLEITHQWPRTPEIACSFRLAPGGLLATVTDGRENRQVLLDWAFGAGTQGITFVGKIPGQVYLEFSLSYYTRKHAFGITPGHESIHPTMVSQALGHPYELYSSSGEILECFQCHSTGAVGVTPDDRIEPGELGVRCEACHGPGSAHRDAAARGLSKTAATSIQVPGRLSAPELNVFCGRCHRVQASGRAPLDLTFSWNVRHQPPYLERSACFRKSSGRLSCLTCHDPHQSAVHGNPDFYNQKCLGCHKTGPGHGKMARQEGCIDCHMPVVHPSEYMQFRSHWIGIYSTQQSGTSTRFTQPKP